MAVAAAEAYDAGAAIVHVHFRDQRPGKGHLPTWDPDVAKAIADAIRAARPVRKSMCNHYLNNSLDIGYHSQLYNWHSW